MVLEKEKFMQKSKITKEEAKDLLLEVRNKIDKLIEKFGYNFIHTCSQSGKYILADDFEWTKGFYTGILWYLYKFTGDKKYFEIADWQTNELLKKARLGHNGIQNHDAGFLYSLSSVAGYKVTGDSKYLEGARLAAKTLSERFMPNCGVIQAWGKMNEKSINSGRIIIDTWMNLPLLSYVGNLENNSNYQEIVRSHLEKSLKTLVRKDYTTYHTYYFDTNSGVSLYGKTHQGKNDESMWARGQSWGIYGLPLNYKYDQTKDSYLKVAKNLLDVFLNKLPSDLVCPWDFDFSDYKDVTKDAGTMPIVALGILELLKYDNVFTTEERKDYELIAHNLIRALIDNDYISFNNAFWEDGLVRHSVYSHNINCRGVNEFCLWGDYFYVEFLMKIYEEDEAISFW